MFYVWRKDDTTTNRIREKGTTQEEKVGLEYVATSSWENRSIDDLREETKGAEAGLICEEVTGGTNTGGQAHWGRSVK